MTTSFSDLNTYLRCPKLFDYRVNRKLQRIRRDQQLQQGTIIHLFLMSGFLAMQKDFWWGANLEEVKDELLEAAATWAFADEMLDIEALIDESLTIVKTFFERETFEGWTILHVEEEFVVTIDGEDVSFTPDLVVRDPNGSVWIVDHKSTTSLPQDGVPFASHQSLLYYAGVKAFYPETAGFLFNYLRKKVPTQPRLNKTMNRETGLYFVNDLNRIDTTYEILFRFIADEAPELFAEPGHKQRLAELRDGPDRFFFTKRILANDDALSQIVEETSQTLKILEFSRTNGYWPRVLRDDRGYTSCGKCEFNSLCQAELLNLNTDIVLREYEPRDPKNEYETEDE